MAKTKAEDIALLLLVGLAFLGRGPFATPPAGGMPDVTGRMGVDTSRGGTGSDTSKPTVDSATGKPNNANTETYDMSGANSKTTPPTDPLTGGNAGDKSNPVTPSGAGAPYTQFGLLPSGFQISADTLARANALRAREGVEPLSFALPSGSGPMGTGGQGGILQGLMSMLGDVGKSIVGLVSPLISSIPISRPIIPDVFAMTGPAAVVTNPAQAAAQKATATLIMTRPDLTYSTGFAGGQQGPTHIGSQFTRNSSQEQVAIKNETQRALALSVALGYTQGNTLADPKSSVYGTKEGYGYFDKITGMWI